VFHEGKMNFSLQPKVLLDLGGVSNFLCASSILIEARKNILLVEKIMSTQKSSKERPGTPAVSGSDVLCPRPLGLGTARSETCMLKLLGKIKKFYRHLKENLTVLINKLKWRLPKPP